MSYYIDECIRNTERVFPIQGRYKFYRFDMNENPEGLPKEFVDTVLKEITPEFLSIYPEPDRFHQKYAQYVGVNPANVLATNGSDMAIRYIMETFGEKGKAVVTVTPSFEMYRVNCSILGYNHIPISYEPDFSIDVEKILRAINTNTRIVVLLNPNNPVGNVYSTDELHRIIKQAQKFNTIVVIDEAYHDFCPISFLSAAMENENVIVLRTFSKLFSLAACRLGVIISNEKIIHYIKNAKLTFDVNSFALLFGEKILERPDIIRDLISAEAEGKSYILNVLQQQGYECRNCQGNFILVKPNHCAREVAIRLKDEKKILVHSYGNELLKDYLRISVGSPKVMQIFGEAFLSVDGGD